MKKSNKLVLVVVILLALAYLHGKEFYQIAFNEVKDHVELFSRYQGHMVIEKFSIGKRYYFRMKNVYTEKEHIVRVPDYMYWSPALKDTGFKVGTTIN